MSKSSRNTGGWSTIESDGGVFTSLVEHLGVQNVQFEEVVSLDPDYLRTLSPVYGVIFLFKWSSATVQDRGEAPQDGTYDDDAVEQGVFFALQKIENACGTQAILSVILNHDERCVADKLNEGIDIGNDLRQYKDFVAGMPPDITGETLSNSKTIRTTHNSFARASPFLHEDAGEAVSEEDSETYHFVGYTRANGRLYELDGLRRSPISHGECTHDAFPEKVMEVIQRRINRYPEGEIRFNLMAVCRDLRLKAEEIGDEEMLQAEQAKRLHWEWENCLRQHNFVGFIGEMLKGVTRSRLQQGEGAYRDWINRGKEQARRRAGIREQLKAARQAQ